MSTWYATRDPATGFGLGDGTLLELGASATRHHLLVRRLEAGMPCWRDATFGLTPHDVKSPAQRLPRCHRILVSFEADVRRAPADDIPPQPHRLTIPVP